MAVIESIVNLGYCSESNFQGTATNYCIFDIKRLKKAWRHPLNFKFPADFDFTLANLQELEQQGKLVPIYTLKDAQFTTAENGVQTFGGGDKKLIEKMPIEIEAMLTNGIQGYQALITIEKATYHSFTLIDVEDTVWVQEGSDGRIGGINSEFMQVLPYTGAGSESASYKINFQLDRLTFDTRLRAIKADSFDFATDDIKGVDDITLTLTAPVNGAGTATFTAKRTKDGHNVEQGGLINTDFLLTANGTAVPGALAYANGVYTFTRTTGTWVEGQTIALKTWDSTLGVQIINVDGQMMKSNVATTVVLQGAPIITSSGTTQMNQGVVDNYAIVATGADSYGVTGTLPTGLSINTSTGLISGTPTNFGTFNVNVTATNEVGTTTMPLVITVTEFTTITPVAPSTAINITSTSLTLIFTPVSTKTRVYQGASTLLGTVNGGNSFDVTGLTAGTTYTFKVKGENESGALTNYSATISVTTEA